MAGNEVRLRLAADGSAQAVAAVDQTTGVMNRAGIAADGFAGGSDRAAAASERLTGAVSRVGHYGALAGALALVSGKLHEMVGRAADQFANMNGRLSLVSDSQAKAAATQVRLFETAQQARQAVGGLADIYFRLYKATGGQGYSEERLLAVTKTLGQPLALSGGNAEALAAQAAAQGALNGLTRVGDATLGLLGGPIGRLTTALSPRAAAWMLWGTESAAADTKSRDGAVGVGADVLAQLKKENDALERKIELLKGSGHQAGRGIAG